LDAVDRDPNAVESRDHVLLAALAAGGAFDLRASRESERLPLSADHDGLAVEQPGIDGLAAHVARLDLEARGDFRSGLHLAVLGPDVEFDAALLFLEEIRNGSGTVPVVGEPQDLSRLADEDAASLNRVHQPLAL
jgi:hypothetical protein